LATGKFKNFLQRDLPYNWKALWQELTKYGDSQRSLLNLARNPYMLTVMIDVYAEDGRLSRNRSELKTLFSEILIKWAEEKCPPGQWLDADIQRHALAVMAFDPRRLNCMEGDQVGWATSPVGKLKRHQPL
jgi:hypothetical protein